MGKEKEMVMKALKCKNNRTRLLTVLAIAAVIGCSFYAMPIVMADPSASTVMGMIVDVIKKICVIVGALFVLLGVVRIVIAHANEDGPAQQKAATMLATGLILVILGTTSMLDAFKTWVS